LDELAFPSRYGARNVVQPGKFCRARGFHPVNEGRMFWSALPNRLGEA
jgi:hypothetical protein